MNMHEISEYVENLPLKASFCKGYRPDEVYEVICNLSSMYNFVLSEAYDEIEELKQKTAVSGGISHIESPLSEVKEEVFKKEEKEPMAEEKMDSSMTDKELQKLKRGELLEIMLEQSRENEALKLKLEDSFRTIEQLKKQLDDRRIDIQKAGTIADASFKLNGVFIAAEKAAQQYLDNLQDLYEREAAGFSKKEAEVETKCTALLQATRERCDFMKEDTEKQCAKLEASVKKRCEELEQTVKKQCDTLRETVERECRERELAAEERCRNFDQKAKEDVDKRWEELSKRLEVFYNAHEGLKDIMAASKMI